MKYLSLVDKIWAGGIILFLVTLCIGMAERFPWLVGAAIVLILVFWVGMLVKTLIELNDMR